MTSSFSFSFAGDDIEDDSESDSAPSRPHAAETGSFLLRQPSTSTPNTAFPTGPSLLPATIHTLESLLASLPSKIAYSTLNVALDPVSSPTNARDDSQAYLRIPRRELWDVRLQLMAEDDEAGLGNLGKDDVKTGVYEGGFKSWESAVDLCRLVAGTRLEKGKGLRVVEMGCGTALPSLCLLQRHLAGLPSEQGPLELVCADYNPDVLRLVTVPNMLLSWAQQQASDTWEAEGELEISEEVLQRFQTDVSRCGSTLEFVSGAWGTEFENLVGNLLESGQTGKGKINSDVWVLAAETIYSPVALRAFAATLMILLQNPKTPGIGQRKALVAAKKVYFGVGGSIEDFCEDVKEKGGLVKVVREESDGVRRAVVEVKTNS